MNALYECAVSHCRLKPKRHVFDYRVFMFCVNLDDLPALGRRLTGFSHNRFNLFSIDDRDHISAGFRIWIQPGFILLYRLACR